MERAGDNEPRAGGYFLANQAAMNGGGLSLLALAVSLMANFTGIAEGPCGT